MAKCSVDVDYHCQILVKAGCLNFRVLKHSVGLPQSGSERFGKLATCFAQLTDLAVPGPLGKI